MPLDDATLQQPTAAKTTDTKKVSNSKKTKKSKPDEIIINPKEDQIIQEEKSKSVAVLFGRMNPPTKGHEENVEGLKKLAKEHHADHVVIASHSQDAKKNPLSSSQKTKHLKRAFPGTHVISSSKEKPTIFHHLSDLHKQGYEHVHIAGGEDRASEYEQVKKYNGKEGKHGLYNFKSITVHSTGERKQGVSGTDMRKHAQNNDFHNFRKNLPSKLAANEKHAKAVFDDTRKGMHLAEHVEILERVVSLQQRRKRSQTMRRYKSKLARARNIASSRLARETNITARTKKDVKAVIRAKFGGSRGLNYKTLSTNDKIAVDRMINKRLTWAPIIQKRMKPKVRQAEVKRLQARIAHKKYINPLLPKPKKSLKNSVDYNELFKQTFVVEQLCLEQFNKIYDLVMDEKFINESDEKSLIKKSDKSGVPLTVLKEVYDRGVQEWSEESNKTPQQVAFERVNSFINQGNTFYTKDKDLNESFNSAFLTARDLGIKAQGGFELHPSVVLEDAASHLRAASELAKQGKHTIASLHRKIADALNRGDRTTASSIHNDLLDKKKELMSEASVSLSFNVPDTFVQMLKKAQKQIAKKNIED